MCDLGSCEGEDDIAPSRTVRLEREPFNTTQGRSRSYSEIVDHSAQSCGPSAPSYRATPGGALLVFDARSGLLSILTIKLPPHQLVNNKKVLSS